MDFAEASNWYDVYMLKRFKHVYNPKSIMEAVDCLFYIFFAQGLEQKAPENDFLDVVHAEHADYVKDAL